MIESGSWSACLLEILYYFLLELVYPICLTNFFSGLIYSWNFFCDHLSIIPYTKTMQINLDVIKNISYNYEAVIIKKISSRVSYYYNY